MNAIGWRRVVVVVFVFVFVMGALLGTWDGQAARAEIVVPGGTLAGDTAWNDTTQPYVVDNLSLPLTVPAGVTLTIGPGVTVQSKYDNRGSLLIRGTLAASGASFEMLTRDVVAQPIIVEENGTATFTGCSLTVERSSGDPSPTTALIVAKGSSTLNLVGSELSNSAVGTIVNRAVWTQDTASLTTAASGGTPTTFSGFPEAILLQSTTAANLADADFSTGTYAIVLDNPAVDLTVADSTFLNFQRALQLPRAGNLTLTNLDIDQTGAVGTRIGVYAYSYTSLTISGAISNMNVGVHVSTAHAGQDVSGVTFTNCNWDLLAEGDWNPGGNRTVAVDTTLPVAHYHVDNPVTIQAGKTLTLQPGTILQVKNLSERMFIVDGTLDADGAIFDTNLNTAWGAPERSVVHARNAGVVQLSACIFIVSMNSADATDYYPQACVYAANDAVVDITGCLFQTSSRYVGPFQRGVAAAGNAAVFIGEKNGVHTRFEGFRRGVVHQSLVDLRLDGVDFANCNHAVVTNTIANFFAYNIAATDCGAGFTLTDLGVLVTDEVVFENTRDALVLGWNRVLSPQIGTAGITFGANSYCTLPGNHTLDRNMLMRAMPYRIRVDQGPITIPAGFTLTFPAGSEVGIFNHGDIFHIRGTLNASETTFNFETRGGWVSSGESCFRFLDTAVGTFTQCTFRSKKTANNSNDIFRLHDTSHVVIRGCAFDGMHGSELGRTRYAISTYDNATARVESYAGTPSSFAHFQTAIWARNFHGLPHVDIDSTLDNCVVGATVDAGANQIIDRDVDITCPWMVLEASSWVHVQTGRRLRFTPGSHLTVNGRRWDGFFIVDGTVRFEGGTVDAYISTASYPLFVVRNSGRLEFVDTQVETSSGDSGTSQRLAHLSDTSSLLLQGASFVNTERRGHAGGYAFVIYSPTVVVTANGAPSHFAGFREAGIYTYGLQPLAGTPNLTFAENLRDIGVSGGYTLSSDLTLPPATRIGFHTRYGTTTVAAGATLTFPAGCHIDNFVDNNAPMHALVVAGAIVASDSRFDVAIYHWDTGGSDFLRLTGSGGGTFTNCQFTAGAWNDYAFSNGRIFDLEGDATLTLRGGTLETPALGRPSWRFRVQSAVRLRGSSRLTIEPHAGAGTVLAGFHEAIIVASDAARLELRDAVLRGNRTALLISQFPAAHTIAGNTFIANTTWALDNQSAGQIDARDNFWGHPAGPRHPANPFGQGDAIRGDVLFQPYLGQGDVEIAALEDHPVGQAPNAFPAPGAVADAVVLRFSVGETTEPIHSYGLRVRITGRDGFVDGMMTNVRLLRDVNGDGLLDGGDLLLAPGVVNLAGNAIDFELNVDLDGDYLVVADFAGLKSGDSLSLGLTAEDVTISPAQFIAGSCAGAHHYLDRLMLSGHPTGRFPDAFLAATDQPERALFGFRLSPGYAVRSLTFRLTDVSGIAAANLANARLLVDTNGNGREDFGEVWRQASNVTLSGTTGSISFAFGANPVPTGVSFVLVADFVNLRRDYAMTVGLPAADVNAGDGVVVTGSAPTSTHVVPAPLMLIDAPFQVANGFVAASQLNNVPLLSFTLTPGGRRVEGVTFELYDVEGIPASTIANARIFVDTNQNGKVDPTETTTVGGLGIPTIDLATGEGTLHFGGSFNTAGGDYILVADVANLTADDTLTITLSSAGVETPANDMVEGGISPVRHAVYRPDLPQAARQTNWTLSYRSPGGLAVTGTYSNDDQRIVVGYSSGTAFTFAADSNTPLTMFHRHFDKVQYAGFSADDSQVVTVTRDGAVYLWNGETGEMENNLFSDLLVRYAVPSPDASKLFIVTEGKALLLDMTTGAILWEFVTGTGAAHQMYAADYAPDGTKILVGHQDKRAYLLDAETGAVIRDFRGHSQAVVGANFAANGTVVMTSSTDSTVTLWRVDDNVNPISNVDLGTEQSLGSGVSRDGSRVAILTVLSGTRRLRMYDDLANLLWQQVLPYTHFTGNFSSVRFNAAGDRVLICSDANANRDLPAALAVQYSAVDGRFLGFVGPRGRTRGRQNSETYQRPRVSQDGNRIFYMHTEGLDVVFPEPGRKIIEFQDVADEESFDITPDGRKMVYTHRYSSSDFRLRYLAIDRDRVTPLAENPLGNINYDPLTLSRTGGLTILGDVLYRTLSGSVYTQSPNPPAAYRSAFSPDESLWGLAFWTDMSIKTMFVGDASGSLEYGVTLTNPYRPVKILYHPDGIRVGCVDEFAGVQFYRLDNNNPVGLYDFRTGSGIPRLHDAALSHDGTMLAIARGNSVRLYDMRTGRVLRYFYPTHSGQADCQAHAVGFGARDNMLWIGWSDSYIELFNRSRVRDLRLNPVARTLPVGRSQQYTVRALYDDGSSVDVTPEYLYRATGAELTPGARLYASPPEAATIEAGKVTVNPGASGDILLTAVYTEGGRTVTAEAILTVGQSPLVALFAQPAALTLAPGVLTPIEYTALFSDGYEERVTSATTLSTTSPDKLRIVGNNVTVLSNATPGDATVVGSYTYDGTTRTAPTVISIHGPESRWEREVVTPGGDTLAMAYSPNGQLLAVGSSSGAVSLYSVGVTTTAYELVDVLPAHRRPVAGVWFRSDTRVTTVGRDGRISQWDLGARGSLRSEFQHEAVITAAGVHQRYLAFGDNLGRVGLFDLDDNAILWMHERHTGETTTVAVDGTHVMSGGKDRKIQLMARTDGAVQMSHSAFARPPVNCRFDGNQMLVLSGDKRLARWDKGTEDGNLREFFFPAEPTALTLHGGQTYVATANNGANAVWIYDANGLLVRWLEVSPAAGIIASLAVTPNGEHLLSGRASAIIEVETKDGEVEEKLSAFHSTQFWHINRGSYSGSLAHSYSLNDAKISADGSLLFTQSARRIYRWGMETGRGKVLSGTRFLETGYFAPYDFECLRMSGGQAGLIGTRVRSSIYLMHAAERLLHMSVHTDATRFGLSPDGTRMITNTAGPLTRFWDVSLDFPTVVAEHASPSADVAFLDNDDSLGSVSTDLFVSIFNRSGQRYSGIPVVPPGSLPGEPPLGGQLSAPLLDDLTASGNAQRVGIVLRYIEEDMFGGITSHNYVQVYDLSDRLNPARIFDRFVGTVEGEIPPVALALSHDGALLFYGLATQDGDGRLHDLTANRELMLFLPPSTGTLSNIGPAAAQFFDGDAALMVAWTEGYAEVYRRAGLDGLRLAPAARSVAAGETLDISAFVAYAGGSEYEVTGRTEFSVEPPAAATVAGNTVTLAGGLAQGTVITVTGRYEELGSLVEGSSTLTVQMAHFTHLSIDPPKVSMNRGQTITVRVFAHYANAGVEEVSLAPDMAWSVSPLGAVALASNILTVPAQAQFGDVRVAVRLIRDGDEREVAMAVHIRQPGSMVNPGDFDGDLIVGFNDLIYFIGHYGETSASPAWDSRCDFDGNGVVNIADATAFVALYGTDYRPKRDTTPPDNLVVVSRDSYAAASVWLVGPDSEVRTGESFEILVYAQDNHPEASGFRGGPITLLFDPERVAFAGQFNPSNLLQPPYNSLFVDGILGADRIEQLAGLTIADGYGDGQPVLYARLPFTAVATGTAAFELAPSTCGLALTPPVGKLTLTSTLFSGDTVLVIDLGLGEGGDQQVDFDLVAGWNLVGIPLHVSNGRGGLVPDQLQFFAWNGRSYQRATSVEAGLAYWVFSDRDCKLIVRGFAVEPAGLPLRRGWNLIAPVTESPPELPPGVRSLYSWQANQRTFAPPERPGTRSTRQSYPPGQGCWVLCTEDDVVLWPNTTPAEPRR